MKEFNLFTFILVLFVFCVFFIIADRTYIKKLMLGAKTNSFASFNKKVIYSMMLLIYILGGIGVYMLTHNILAAMLFSFLPAVIPYIIYDLIFQYLLNKEQKQATELVMILSKWSLIKNDLIYCLKKVGESDLKNPTKKMMNKAYIRICGGMDIEKALKVLEEDALGDNLSYLVKNIRFSAKKGGDLQTLFKNTQEQYFKVDEELFKRKISSYRDRMTIYAVMVFVLLIAFWFISRDDSVCYFYLKTALGQNIMGGFCVMYCIGVMLTVKQ